MSYGVRPTGHRLPDDTHLGAVRLLVTDLAQSLIYYQQVLGLRCVSRTPNSASLAAETGSPLLHLDTRRGVRTTPQGERLGLYHFALLVPDRPALGRFLTHLRDSRIPVSSADHAVSEALYLWDPDNLGIEVYVDRPQREWRQRGDELYMTTERLDVRSLVASADGQSWRGLPAGTRVGHMHLHVGDLGGAEAFYHSALGFDKIVWSYPGALFLSAGGYHHHLGTNTWAAPAPPRAEDEAGLLEWEMILPSGDDVEAAAAHVSARSFDVERDARGVLLRDPWGTRVRLLSNLER
jgi:catechol 2,3-dioxygenase